MTRTIEAPAAVVWDVLVDLAAWPSWGPSVRGASIDGGGLLAVGAHGTVETAVGVSIPFEVTRFEPGVRWAWTVAGIGATDHRVEALGPDRCRLGFGVPWLAAPYAAVCRVALGRIEELALERLRGGGRGSWPPPGHGGC